MTKRNRPSITTAGTGCRWDERYHTVILQARLFVVADPAWLSGRKSSLRVGAAAPSPPAPACHVSLLYIAAWQLHVFFCRRPCGIPGVARRTTRILSGLRWRACCNSGIGRVPWLSADVLGRVDELAPFVQVSGFVAVHTQHVFASWSPRRPSRAWYGASASASLAKPLRGMCWRCFSVAAVRAAFSWSWSSCLSWLVLAGRS